MDSIHKNNCPDASRYTGTKATDFIYFLVILRKTCFGIFQYNIIFLITLPTTKSSVGNKLVFHLSQLLHTYKHTKFLESFVCVDSDEAVLHLYCRASSCGAGKCSNEGHRHHLRVKNSHLHREVRVTHVVPAPNMNDPRNTDSVYIE